MADVWGRNLRVALYGESHGPSIGVVLDGLPPGFSLDMGEIARDMARRAPGQDDMSTPRREDDAPVLQSGVYGGKTTGGALCALIANTSAHSADYRALADTPRPGHADYTGMLRYDAANDPRGGGHFSGRLTAPLVFAGSVARQLLAAGGITVGAHIAAIGTVEDAPFDACALAAAQLCALRAMSLPVLDTAQGARMREAVAAARAQGDSLGGRVEVAAVGMPAGLGDPFFDSLESRIAALMFSIPAVKAVSFGDGFALCQTTGSRANDALVSGAQGEARTQTNHNGGINGGISNGMPILVQAGIKPTPSIARAQRTLNLKTGQMQALCIGGRHDPCIVPRAVPVAEAAVLLALLDALLEGANPRAQAWRKEAWMHGCAIGSPAT